MKAESIEQIREHLERGGRVIYGDQRIVEAVTSTGRVLLGNGYYLEFDAFEPSSWELLPIEEEIDAGKVWCDQLSEMRQNQEALEMQQRIRTALLYGRRPEMQDLLDWWQATTGERIEHGERCTVCDGTGQQVLNALTVRGVRNPVINQPCPACKDHPGYTVRPTWMEVGK